MHRRTSLNLLSMKRIFHITLLFATIICCFQACKKNFTTLSHGSSDQNLIESSRRFFEGTVQQSTKSPSGNYRNEAVKNLIWAAAHVLQLSNGPAVVVPVHYLKSLS